jgi:glutathione S-transferase
MRLTAAAARAKTLASMVGLALPGFPLRRGNAMFHYTSLVTLASVFFYFWVSMEVGKARIQYKIAAPATTGDPAFERLFRIQMNTLEWLPIYLPCLWLFAYFVSDFGGFLLGLVWIGGRYLYKRGYEEAPEKRTLGFAIQATAVTLLFFGALFDNLVRIVFGD